MNLHKLLFLLLFVAASKNFAEQPVLDAHETIQLEQTVPSETGDYNTVELEFTQDELDKPSEIQEPSRIQAWAQSVAIAMLMKYPGLFETLFDMQERVAQWWHTALVFCHIRSQDVESTSNEPASKA